MKAEIIAVGTELLMGQIVNTNAHYLSGRLAGLGIDLYFQTVVGDNRTRLQEALAIAAGRSDLIICTGGLGPTQDDLTKDVLALFAGRKLVLDEPSMRHIEQAFNKRKALNPDLQMAESNSRQALIPEGADALANETGLAAGAALIDKGKCYILLPGPPREMKPMFDNEAVPWLRSHLGLDSSLFSRIVKFAGIGESMLEQRMLDLIGAQSDPTIAPYAKEGEVAIRLTTRAPSREEAERKIAPLLAELRRRFKPHLFAEEDLPLEAAVVRLLAEKGLTLASAESCTGGMFGELITSVAGSSAVYAGGIIAYSNAIKSGWLDVPASLLEGENAPGAVSAETAALMAERAMERAGTDFGVAITGVAGPAHSERKPVGLVFVALAERSRETFAEECRFSGNREMIRVRSAKQALYRLWQRAAE